ncbi:DUF1735 domain-containing protein [Pedobacter steynii]
MKFNYITKSIVPLAVVVLSLSSCLKDEIVDQDFSGVNKSFIGIYDASPSSSSPNTTSTGIVASDATAVVELEVGYIGQGVSPGGDVTVEFDPNVLQEYNSLTGSDYELLSAGDFDMPSSITIPAGQKSVKFQVTLKPRVIVQTDEDIVKLFGLPIRVTKGPEALSGNYSKHVLLISVKNQYDGEFDYKGKITRNSASGPDLTLGGNFKGLTANLITRSPNTVWFDSQVWATGAGVAGIGDPESDGVIFTIDQTTNKVTISCPANPSLKNTAGYDSRYDPATKTFYVAFDWGTAPATRIAVDTLVRTGARP